MLDPRKVFFTQADVDGFMDYRDQLDDMALQGRHVVCLPRVSTSSCTRIDERVKLVDELLPQPQDFTVDEDMVTDPDKISYAKDDAEMRDRWRKRIKYDLLELATEKPQLEGKAAAGKDLEALSQFAKRMKQTDNDELLEMYLTALTTAYDPHTSYMSPDTLENFDIQMQLNLDGIGAALEAPDGYTVVKKIIPGGAAAKDGRLKPEDKIIGVGQGADGPIVDVVDMKLNDVVQADPRQPGHDRPPGGRSQGRDRAQDLQHRAPADRADRQRSPQRDPRSRQEGRRHAVQDRRHQPAQLLHGHERRQARPRRLQEHDPRRVAGCSRISTPKKVDAVVLDLRQNGGGSLTEAINLTGLFIDNGPVVQVKDSDGQKPQYDDTDRGVAWDGPLVVLTSKFSASASEIFAGAIQDYGRGLIVGDTSTHGKGTVQSLLDLGQQLFRGMPNAPALGRAEDHDAAVLSPRRRQHAESRRAVRRRAAVADQPARRRRIEPRLRPEVRPRRSAAAPQVQPGRHPHRRRS